MDQQAVEVPTCIAVVVCDEVYQDRESGKRIAVGLFNRLVAASFPVRHPQMSVLFSVTNARGKCDLRLTIEAETGEVIAELRGPFASNDPLLVSDICVRFRGIIFPRAGKYWACVKSGEQVLAQRPFMVSELAKKEETPT